MMFMVRKSLAKLYCFKIFSKLLYFINLLIYIKIIHPYNKNIKMVGAT
jgi:hypothetical protein